MSKQPGDYVMARLLKPLSSDRYGTRAEGETIRVERADGDAMAKAKQAELSEIEPAPPPGIEPQPTRKGRKAT